MALYNLLDTTEMCPYLLRSLQFSRMIQRLFTPLRVYVSKSLYCPNISLSDLGYMFIIIIIIIIIIIVIKINQWLTALMGATSVDEISATDWQMAVRRNNVFSITLPQELCRLFNSDPLLLNQVTIQLSSRGCVDPVPNLIHI